MTDAAAPTLWVLHCDQDGQPAIVDWAASEEAAEQKLAALREEQQQFKFWATTLTADEAARYRDMGLIPDDA